VPCHEERTQRYAAQGDRVAVRDHAIHHDGFPASGPQSRVVPARRERDRVTAERYDLSARGALHGRVSLHVVPVRMTGDHDPDIPHTKPELLDVRDDLLVHVRGARVVENVALGRGDEVGAVFASDEVDVSDDAERFGGATRRLHTGHSRMR